MLVDITLKITPQMVKDAEGNEKKALVGHLGTHFDVMDKEFPLEYLKRKAIVFDVSNVKNREIEKSDIDFLLIEKDMFVGFYTGFIEENEYGTKTYFKEHPELSLSLVEELVKKEISIIGIDFAGVRRGKEHTPTDQYCADHDIFIVENLCNLNSIVNITDNLMIYTFPMNYANMSGLPSRVIAEY